MFPPVGQMRRLGPSSPIFLILFLANCVREKMGGISHFTIHKPKDLFWNSFFPIPVDDVWDKLFKLFHQPFLVVYLFCCPIFADPKCQCLNGRWWRSFAGSPKPLWVTWPRRFEKLGEGVCVTKWWISEFEKSDLFKLHKQLSLFIQQNVIVLMNGNYTTTREY